MSKDFGFLLVMALYVTAVGSAGVYYSYFATGQLNDGDFLCEPILDSGFERIRVRVDVDPPAVDRLEFTACPECLPLQVRENATHYIVTGYDPDPVLNRPYFTAQGFTETHLILRGDGIVIYSPRTAYLQKEYFTLEYQDEHGAVFGPA